MNALEKYTKKIAHNTVHVTRAQTLCATCKRHIAIVIPVLDEYPTFCDTLKSVEKSIAHNGVCGSDLEFIIYCVVNNRKNSDSAEKENNQQMLAWLNAYTGCAPLCVIDAASSGREIPENQGVGYARKIGMDYALISGAAVLACMDADTLVAKEYAAVLHGFAKSGESAAVLQFSHQKTENAAAIFAYERYLREHSARLKAAGTPYFHIALGPCIVCTAKTYAAAGGMNKRLAGEDFYFLQALTKVALKNASALPLLSAAEGGALVFPSARFSRRVPFGTGTALAAMDFSLAPRSAFDALAFFIDTIHSAVASIEVFESDTTDTSENPQAVIRCKNPRLYRFLEQENFGAVWEKLRQNSPDRAHLLTAFHCWFDGLKIIRLLHYLEKSPA
ncbi:MAG: hypothetical protein Ta2A_25730 [Treponemataceae bacterium]|nr:MAG: hypothetical protein Ta2A_25730 [Treponemataceae bacterium]